MTWILVICIISCNLGKGGELKNGSQCSNQRMLFLLLLCIRHYSWLLAQRWKLIGTDARINHLSNMITQKKKLKQWPLKIINLKERSPVISEQQEQIRWNTADAWVKIDYVKSNRDVEDGRGARTTTKPCTISSSLLYLGGPIFLIPKHIVLHIYTLITLTFPTA